MQNNLRIILSCVWLFHIQLDSLYWILYGSLTMFDVRNLVIVRNTHVFAMPLLAYPLSSVLFLSIFANGIGGPMGIRKNGSHYG